MKLKPFLYKNQKIGFIGNYFTEQLFQRDFQVKILERHNCEAFVEDSQLSCVLIDTEFFNVDNSWGDFTLSELIEYLEALNLLVILISYNKELINSDYYTILITDISDSIEYNEERLKTPFLINEYIYNPINNKKTNYLTILDDEKNLEDLSNHCDTRLFDFFKKEQAKIECLDFTNLTKANMLNISKLIKKSKVVYVDRPEKFSNTLLKYIQLICSSQNTALIFRGTYSAEALVIYEDEIDNIINLLKSYKNKSILNDHSEIKKSRNVFLNNSLMKYNNLPNILNGHYNDSNKVKISVITSTIRKNNIFNLIKQMNQQNFVDLEIILLTHGFTLSKTEKLEVKESSKFPIKILSEERTTVYGTCLNKCIENMNYEYFAKVDDDDLYFPNYLIDSWISYQYSKASIVGKHSSFWYFENQDMTSIRFENQAYKYTKYIAGATIFTSKQTINQYKFSPLASGIDSDLLKRISEDRKLIYCNSPYEFSVFRDSDSDSHTWKVDELYLLRSSKILFYGTSLKASLSVNNNF